MMLFLKRRLRNSAEISKIPGGLKKLQVLAIVNSLLKFILKIQ